jgi:hypothetical protein
LEEFGPYEVALVARLAVLLWRKGSRYVLMSKASPGGKTNKKLN